MSQEREPRFSLAEVVSELGGDQAVSGDEAVVSVEINDRLFIGGGCESWGSPEEPPELSVDGEGPNLSICLRDVVDRLES